MAAPPYALPRVIISATPARCHVALCYALEVEHGRVVAVFSLLRFTICHALHMPRHGCAMLPPILPPRHAYATLPMPAPLFSFSDYFAAAAITALRYASAPRMIDTSFLPDAIFFAAAAIIFFISMPALRAMITEMLSAMTCRCLRYYAEIFDAAAPAPMLLRYALFDAAPRYAVIRYHCFTETIHAFRQRH